MHKCWHLNVDDDENNGDDFKIGILSPHTCINKMIVSTKLNAIPISSFPKRSGEILAILLSIGPGPQKKRNIERNLYLISL